MGGGVLKLLRIDFAHSQLFVPLPCAILATRVGRSDNRSVVVDCVDQAEVGTGKRSDVYDFILECGSREGEKGGNGESGCLEKVVRFHCCPLHLG